MNRIFKINHFIYTSILILFIILFNLNGAYAFSKHSSMSSYPYLIGNGVYDITGPAAEIDMMGYAKPKQIDNGIHMRLRSRAFIVVDRETNKRIVFVSADLGMIFESIKSGVVQTLLNKYHGLYNDNNVMISAIHTHSGPGGYAYHALFNITVRGFIKQNYDAIINGIVHSIERADSNLEPGNIYINRGTLLNANGNRSIKAYLKNPKSERQHYSYNVDKTMTVLKFMNSEQKPIGMINWFPVHGVSMSNKNTLISSDNKGYAGYLFEKKYGTDYAKQKTFVAAFAQANEGDVTPNIFSQQADANCDDFSCGDFKRLKIISQRQYEKALELFNHANERLSGPVDYRHTYTDMNTTSVPEDYNPYSIHTTCQAAVGYAFGAGTTDGEGSFMFYQGELKGNIFINALRDVITPPSRAMLKCQKPKPIMLALGNNKPYPWVPHNMPIQILRIGQFAILGVPGEFTTMSGRRLREHMQSILKPDISHIVISGLSNSYAGYIATPEEYLQQNYEGGFTVFGPLTEIAYDEKFTEIANDMKQGKKSHAGPLPQDLSQHQVDLVPNVLYDNVPPKKHFGDILQDTQSSYHHGDIVKVSFWGANPRNDLQTQKTFLKVQRLMNNQWITIENDWDWDTIYRWQRVGISYSKISIIWHISDAIKPGTYRIEHIGHYKNGWDGHIYSYHGYSQTFKVIEKS